METTKRDIYVSEGCRFGRYDTVGCHLLLFGLAAPNRTLTLLRARIPLTTTATTPMVIHARTQCSARLPEPKSVALTTNATYYPSLMLFRCCCCCCCSAIYDDVFTRILNAAFFVMWLPIDQVRLFWAAALLLSSRNPRKIHAAIQP